MGCSENNKPNAITSCTFTWDNWGLIRIEDIDCVKTRILQKEIQIRFYNYFGLINGKIFPLSKQQSQELFSLIEQCYSEWETDDYSVDVADGSCWELKLYSKGKSITTIKGTVKYPPRGQEIKNMIAGIIGNDDLYIFV